MSLTDYSIDRYATAVIEDKPANFNGIEINGVSCYQTGADSYTYEVDNIDPSAYSVYLRHVDDTAACVGDFARVEDARAYAIELHMEYSWPVSDFTLAGRVH